MARKVVGGFTQGERMLCAEGVLEKLKLQLNLFFTATPLTDDLFTIRKLSPFFGCHPFYSQNIFKT